MLNKFVGDCGHGHIFENKDHRAGIVDSSHNRLVWE